MPTQVQFRRGTEAQNNAFTGAAGELTVNTSNSSIRVHDGSTAGGVELALNSALSSTNQSLASTDANIATAIISATYGNNISNGTITAARLPTVLTSGTDIADVGINGARSTTWFQEKANIIAGALGTTYNSFDVADGVVHYLTSDASANTTVNLKGFADRDTTNTVSMAIVVTNGASPFYITGVQIDGANANVLKWGGGTAPAEGHASNIDVYSFSVIKTDVSTYTVLANQTQFG